MTAASRADRALADLLAWSGGSEPDTYPYIKDFFCEVLGYPKAKVRINESQEAGIPDLSLFSEGSAPQGAQPWIVCEVKPDKGYFRTDTNRQRVWANQLRRYVGPETVYALLIDPTSVVVLFPDGRLCGDVIALDKASASSLRDAKNEHSLAFISFENSVATSALQSFVDGESPTGYIDVREGGGQSAFELALRISARDLQEYAVARVREHYGRYTAFTAELASLHARSIGTTSWLRQQETKLRQEYAPSIRLREDTLPFFEATIGRELPDEEPERQDFISRIYAIEAANLVLARILFVRFFEDYGMAKKKISNGGIRAFREFNSNIKDDYQFLLQAAFRDLKAVYARLFEESVFDWAHEGDGELSRLLLRVFYRLNAFDFTQITGDNLGNLYERFLDPKSRKESGEFYTPEWVADHILKQTGFADSPGSLLDPACGSGTFLFRAIEMAIQSFRSKGVPYGEAIEEAVKLVNGIDINIFAAFIAQLQVIWHLFPHLRAAGKTPIRIPDLNIYGGIDSLDSGAVRSFEEDIIPQRESAARSIRDASYRYVVGNPPYIRAERMKSGERWTRYYSAVIEGKKDVAHFFVYRAIAGGAHGIEPWLEPRGKLGFILPFSVADSKAASKLRRELVNNRLLALTDLETVAGEVFTSGIAPSRQTVAPVVVVASREERPIGDYPVSVTVASRTKCITPSGVDLGRAETSEVRSSVFSESRINPFQHFATKLSREDAEVFERLFAGDHTLRDFAASIKPKTRKVAIGVGLRIGTGNRAIFPDSGAGRPLLAKGLHVHSFGLDRSGITEFVEVAAAHIKSIWAYPWLLGRPAYMASEICYAPQFCAVDTKTVVVHKTAAVFVPNKASAEFPWDLYLNSSVIRLLYLTLLRSALIDGVNMRQSHLNADAIKAMPVPKGLLEQSDALSQFAVELRRLAGSILRQQDALAELAESEATSPLATLDIQYKGVGDYEAFRDSDPAVERIGGGRARLTPRQGKGKLGTIEGDEDLLEVLAFLAKEPFEIEPAPSAEIPRDWKALAKRIRELDPESNPDVKSFRSIYAKADRAVSFACGLRREQVDYVERRLAADPLVAAQPRWPWTPAQRRKTKTYDSNRFD